MKFKKFKAGDKVFFPKVGWTVLEDTESEPYSLAIASGIETFTKEGKHYEGDAFPYIFDHNPFDPNDPKNPPEYRSDWPFMLNGRRVKEGDILNDRSSNQNLPVRALYLEDGEVFCGLRGVPVSLLHPNHFCWPDELPVKKKVAKWAYPISVTPGAVAVGFTEEMTEEEAKKKYGLFVHVIPGTEREVEG